MRSTLERCCGKIRTKFSLVLRPKANLAHFNALFVHLPPNSSPIFRGSEVPEADLPLMTQLRIPLDRLSFSRVKPDRGRALLVHFIRKYQSAFFAVIGALTYLACREFGLAWWSAFAIALASTASVALLIRPKPSGTRLD